MAAALNTLRASGLQVVERPPLVLPAGSVAAPVVLGLGQVGAESALENAVVGAQAAAVQAGSTLDAELDVVVVTVPCLDWVGVDGTS
jgi:hypothetical protein